MKVVLNVEARNARIQKYYREALEEICQNADLGINQMDLIFPNDLVWDVRDKIDENFKAHNVDYRWSGIMVDKGINIEIKLYLK